MQMNARRAKRALGLLVRPTSGKRSVEMAAEQAASNARRLAAYAQTALLPEPVDPAYEGLARLEPKARFAAAMQARRVEEVDLPDIEATARLRFRLWFVVMVLFIGYLIAAPRGWFQVAAVPLLGWLPVLAVGALILARLARASFWLYQVQARALVPFQAWLRDPTAWLGAPPSALAAALAALGAAAWMFDPGLAMADPPSPVPGAGTSADLQTALGWLQSAIHANDLSMRWLTKLFPDAVSGTAATATGTDLWRTLFQAVNSVLLFFGAGVMSVHTIIGTAATAHEGKVLGNRWHQMWAPVRISLGVASLAPIKGYCLAQLLAVQVLAGSYAFADGIWGLYVANLVAAPTGAVVSAPAVDLGDRVLVQVLTNEVCATFVQKKGVSVGSGSWLAALNPWSEDRPASAVPAKSTPTSDGGALWDYGSLCGALKLNVSPEAKPVNGEPGMVDYTVVAPAITAFDTTRAQLLGRFIGTVRSSGLVDNIVAATMIGSNERPNLTAMKTQYATIKEAATRYNADLITAAKTLATTLDTKARARFIAQSVELGWASAGALNAAVVQLSASAMEHAQSGLPEYHGPDLRRADKDGAKEVQRAIDMTQTLIASMGAANAIDGGGAPAALGITESGDVVERVFKTPINGLARWVAGKFPLDEINPMGTIQSEGQAILVAGEAALVTFGVMRAAVAGAEKAGENGISNITAAAQSAILEGLRTSAPIIMTIIGGMLILGTVEAYIVPMIPFVSWFFAIIGCASFAVEFVIAAPLAALMHVRMDGDELVNQQQKPFYTMLFNGALRPTLLLFGLFASNIVFSVMAGFLNSTFGLAMSAAQGSHITGIAGILGLMCLLMYLHYQLAVRCMELVHRVPQMVSRFVGAEDLDQDTHRNSTNIAGAVVGMVQRGGAHVNAAAFGAGGPGGDKDGGGKPNRGDGGDPATQAASVSGASKIGDGSVAAADQRPSANAEGGVSPAGDGGSIAKAESANTDRDR